MKFDRLIDIARAMYNPEEHTLRTFHFSAILLKNRVISLGVNNPKTHPINLKNPKISHDGLKNIKADGGSCSELKACLRLKRTNIDSERCLLVNIRLTKTGELAYSRPCQSCVSLLRYFNFKKVYFTNEFGFFEEYNQE